MMAAAAKSATRAIAAKLMHQTRAELRCQPPNLGENPVTVRDNEGLGGRCIHLHGKRWRNPSQQFAQGGGLYGQREIVRHPRKFEAQMIPRRQRSASLRRRRPAAGTWAVIARAHRISARFAGGQIWQLRGMGCASHGRRSSLAQGPMALPPPVTWKFMFSASDPVKSTTQFGPIWKNGDLHSTLRVATTIAPAVPCF